MDVTGTVAWKVIAGSFTTEAFNEWVREYLLPQMNPYPLPNSVLVLDNCAIHHSDELREILAAKGCRLLYLPPYSPDYNPIELFFGWLKSYLIRHDEWAARVGGNEALDTACYMFRRFYKNKQWWGPGRNNKQTNNVQARTNEKHNQMSNRQ
jgi:transposase